MNVKIERIKKGMTQLELSKKTGIGRITISKIEKGQFENVKLSLLIKIADALDTNVTELFLGDNKQFQILVKPTSKIIINYFDILILDIQKCII